MKFSVYRWMIQSLHTARTQRRKQAMELRRHQKNTHGKIPYKVSCGNYMNPALKAVSHKNQVISHGDLALFNWNCGSPQRNHNPEFSLNSQCIEVYEKPNQVNSIPENTLSSPISGSILQFQPFWKCLKLCLQIHLASISAMHYQTRWIQETPLIGLIKLKEGEDRNIGKYFSSTSYNI